MKYLWILVLLLFSQITFAEGRTKGKDLSEHINSIARSLCVIQVNSEECEFEVIVKLRSILQDALTAHLQFAIPTSQTTYTIDDTPKEELIDEIDVYQPGPEHQWCENLFLDVFDDDNIWITECINAINFVKDVAEDTVRNMSNIFANKLSEGSNEPAYLNYLHGIAEQLCANHTNQEECIADHMKKFAEIMSFRFSNPIIHPNESSGGDSE